MKISALSRIKGIVQSRDRAIGTFITSTDPATTTIFGSLGFDFLMLDAEHGPIDLSVAAGHIRAAEATDVIALVRVIENSPKLIQSFLDLGANGVIVPHVNSADAAARAVLAARYGRGGRGMCPVCHAAKYSVDDWQSFVRHSNDEVLVVPMIEAAAAVESIAEICAVPGVEILLFGPGDLAQDMGLDLFTDLESLIPSWISVRDAIHAAGKLVMVPDGFGLEGADIIFRDMDLLIMRHAAKKILEEFRSNQSSN